MRNRQEFIGKIEKGEIKNEIYDDNMNSLDLQIEHMNFIEQIFDDAINMAKIRKFNCYLLKNISYHYWHISFNDKYHFEDIDTTFKDHYSKKLKLNKYYIKDNTNLTSLDKYYKSFLNFEDKNEFFLDPILLQKKKNNKR